MQIDLINKKEIAEYPDVEQVCNELLSLIEFQKGNYIVYMHINPYNNLKYVGITCQNPPEKRWCSGAGYRCRAFAEDIKNYGWDNFIHVILFSDINLQNARKIERYIIKKLELKNVNHGYNRSDGGETVSMLGKHHTEQACKKMSQTRHEKYSTHPETHPWLGREHSKQSKQKMREHSHRSQKVMCVETQEIYISIHEATERVGLKSKNSILLALNDSTKTAKGYHWKRVNEEAI